MSLVTTGLLALVVYAPFGVKPAASARHVSLCELAAGEAEAQPDATPRAARAADRVKDAQIPLEAACPLPLASINDATNWSLPIGAV